VARHAADGLTRAVPSSRAVTLSQRTRASPAQLEDAMRSTAYKYANGDPYTALGPFTSSRDKGPELVDVVAAARQLGAC
jgi:hypothetical protein